jgi:hypothetical protein
VTKKIDEGRIPGAFTVPTCIQLRLEWTAPSTKLVYNVLHGTVAGGFTATSAIAEAVRAAIVASGGWTSWKARVSTTWSLSHVDLRDMRTLNMPIVQSTGGAAAGTGATGAIPPGEAFCVTLRTAQAGRFARGRVYLPGLDFSALAAGGVAAAGTLTDAVSFVTAVQTAMTASGLTLAIMNPARQLYTGSTGAVHPARAAAMQTVTSIVARNNIIDHQRRRSGRS